LKVKSVFMALVLMVISPVQSINAKEPVDLKIRELLLSKHIYGSITVVKNAETVFNEGVGFADRSRQKANVASTTFPIGSITKTVVAVSIMQLQEKGKLSVNDSLSRFFPDIPNARKIKIFHLLTHTSGIRSPLLGRDPEEIAEDSLQKPLKFQAGIKWDYNDINYIILGVILERAANQPLHEYIQTHIFNRVSMKDSGFMTKKNPVPYQATGYIRAGGQYLPAKNMSLSMLFGCGDIYSTSYDLYKFDEALMTGKLVNGKSLKQILTPGSKSNYGMGLYITNDSVYSRGVLNGWESLHVFYQDGISIVILLNVRDKNINIHQLAKGIYTIVHS
jgi:CubicO group peptidase (beta-lactamase class C family)